MTSVGKKLREAAFFLGKLDKRSRTVFGEREQFDYYLSAFLNACRSVDYRLRHEQGNTYRTFRCAWDSRLQPRETELLKFMVDDRNLEVHESGSARTQQDERVAVSDSYTDESGTAVISSPLGLGALPTEIVRSAYTFAVSGRQVAVTECCRRYLELLERLVRDYGNHIGAP